MCVVWPDTEAIMSKSFDPMWEEAYADASRTDTDSNASDASKIWALLALCLCCFVIRQWSRGHGRRHLHTGCDAVLLGPSAEAVISCTHTAVAFVMRHRGE